MENITAKQNTAKGKSGMQNQKQSNLENHCVSKTDLRCPQSDKRFKTAGGKMNTADITTKSTNQNIKIIISHLIGTLGSGIFSFGIGLMILKETGSATNFGFSQIVGPLASLLLLPVTGSVVDRSHRKYIAVSTQIVSILGIFFFLIANHFGILPKLLLIYLLLTILAITDLFLTTTYSASIITMVKKEDVQKIMSGKQIVMTLSMIGAPVLGSLLYSFLNFDYFLIFEIMTEIITLLIVLTLNFYLFPMEAVKGKDSQNSNSFSQMWGLFKEGIAFVKTSAPLRFMLSLAMFVNMVFASVLIGFPYLCVNVFAFDSTQYGVIQASFYVGLLGISILLANKKDFKRPLYLAWILVFACFIVMLIAGFNLYFKFDNSINFIVMLLCNLAFGVLVGLVNIPTQVWQVKTIPANMQGRISNLSSTLSKVLMPIGILFFGAVFDLHIRADFIFIFSAIAGAIIMFAIPYAIKVKLSDL